MKLNAYVVFATTVTMTAVMFVANAYGVTVWTEPTPHQAKYLERLDMGFAAGLAAVFAMIGLSKPWK